MTKVHFMPARLPAIRNFVDRLGAYVAEDCVVSFWGRCYPMRKGTILVERLTDPPHVFRIRTPEGMLVTYKAKR